MTAWAGRFDRIGSLLPQYRRNWREEGSVPKMRNYSTSETTILLKIIAYPLGISNPRTGKAPLKEGRATA
jgi:hypothetical protein